MSSSATESRPTDRDGEIDVWLANTVGAGYRKEPASSDASFRRYLRIYLESSTRILMDAPPEREDCRPFVRAQTLLHDAGVNVPEIIEADLDRGLLLLSDLGSRKYLDALDDNNCDSLYADAVNSLQRMQLAVPGNAVPDYDRKKLNHELQLFPDWFLGKHLGIEISGELRQTLEDCFETLIPTCLEQPQVFVHRDYHSRNLMWLKSGNPGVLDFQDAVRGPITYDLVSLFRDVYIAWPAARVEGWMRSYFEQIKTRCDGLVGVDAAAFRRWFDLTGVQRHIKVAGIFCRLWYRDGKPGYLRDIPLTLRYLMQAGAQYPETQPLVEALRAVDLEARLELANSAALTAYAQGVDA